MALVKGKAKVTRNASNTKGVEAFLAKFKNSSVTVGVHNDAGQYPGANAPTVAQVAFWNEFGTVKMPERSFLRSTMQEQARFIQSLLKEQVEKCMQQDITAEKALKVVGFNVQALVQKKIESNVPPELSPSYLAQKKRKFLPERTLIATRLLLRSVTFRVNMGAGSVKKSGEP